MTLSSNQKTISLPYTTIALVRLNSKIQNLEHTMGLVKHLPIELDLGIQ